MKHDYKDIHLTCRKDLVHFKKILLAKRQRMLKQLDLLSENIDQLYLPDVNNESSGKHSKIVDLSVSRDEINTILYEQALIYVEKLDEAIERIEKGTHCFCENDADDLNTN